MLTGYLRRNGAMTSDQATMITHFIRHGDHADPGGGGRRPGLFDRALLYNADLCAESHGHQLRWHALHPGG